MIMLFWCEVWHPKYIPFDFGNYFCGLLKLDSLMRYVYLHSVQSEFPFPFYAGRTHMCVQQDNNPSCYGLGTHLQTQYCVDQPQFCCIGNTFLFYLTNDIAQRVNWAYETKLYNHE